MQEKKRNEKKDRYWSNGTDLWLNIIHILPLMRLLCPLPACLFSYSIIQYSIPCDEILRKKKLSSNYGNALLLLLNSISKYLSISYKIWGEKNGLRKFLFLNASISLLLPHHYYVLISLNEICCFCVLFVSIIRIIDLSEWGSFNYDVYHLGG